MKADDIREAQCWVCVQQGVTGMYPVSQLIKLTQGKYRCRNHKGAEILEAGKKRKKETI